MTSPTTLAALRLHPLAVAIRRAAGKRPLHLVGGTLRDALLDLPAHDFDLVTGGGGEPLAERLAESLPARLVRLGGERFAALRLVGEGFQVDIWDRAEADLAADLARRDFTVNSMALDLTTGELIDPHAGRRDALTRRLRATTPDSLRSDPLRVVRMARFAGPPWRLEPDRDSRELARRAVDGLEAVAPERLRQELLAILSSADAATALELLAEVEALARLLGLDPTEVPRLARHVDHDGRRLEELLARRDRLRGAEAGAPSSAVAAEVAARVAARLAVLGRAVESAGGGKAASILQRAGRHGLVTRRHADAAVEMLAAELPAAEEAARRRFLHRAGESWDLALCVAVHAAGGDPRRLAAELAPLTELAQRHGEAIFQPRPLLDGRQIERLTGVPAGPRLGRLVGELRAAQVEGRVRTRDEAVELVRTAARLG